MSFFSFLKRNKESHSLVFNIGSGSISGGIISFTEAPGENVSYYAKETIPFQEEISVSRHLELMRSSLNILTEKIRLQSVVKKIDRIFYVFSSPWCISQTKIIRIKETRPFKVTDSYLNKIVAEQEKIFQKEISKVGQIIEKKIIQVKINGYPINNFYNKITRDLEVVVFLTIVPSDVLKIAESVISRYFNSNEVWCHSLSLSLLSIIKNLFPQKDDFISLQVSEEITDIAIIGDGVIVSSASVPLGRNDFIRELSKVLRVSEELANSQIKIHGLKASNELGAMKLAVAMDKAGLSWLNKINETLNGFKDKIHVPDSVFLIAGPDIAEFLKDKIEKQDFKVLLLDNKKVKPPIPGNDLIFKLVLMFLDNLYKI